MRVDWRWIGSLVAVAVAVAGARWTRAQDLASPPPDVPIFTPCAPVACCDPPCRLLDPLGMDPVWTGRAEALLLWRDAPQGVPFYQFVDGGDLGGVALDASDFQSGMAAGPRFTLFRHTGDMGAIEFNYLRVQSFTAARQLPTVEDGYVDIQPHGLYCCNSSTFRESVGGRMSSDLQSFELNRRFPTDGRLGWLAGFRWVEWNDGIGLQSVTPDNEGSYVRDYLTRTSNDLYGMQIGADSILYGLGRSLRLEGIGKAGVYYNDAGQSSRLYAGDVDQTLAVSTSTGRAAFVGEVGLTGVYDITDRISVRAGYTIFWLGGLALAPNQFDRQMLCPGGEEIMGATDTGGSVFVQGLSLGLEGRW